MSQQSQTTPAAPVAVSLLDLAGLTSRPAVRVTNFAVLMIIAAIVSFVREIGNGEVMLFGAIASIYGAHSFSRTLLRGEGNAMKAMLPYLYGCYLVFYRGFWGARVLAQEFSLATLLWHAMLVFVGYRIVFWTWQLTEVGDALRTGRLVVRDGPNVATAA